MSDFLKGKTAVITGASRGLGRAMALALAEAGVRLALVARDEAKLAEVAGAAREKGAEAECYPADVTSEAEVLELERQVRQRFGSAQILINNAGVNLRKLVSEFTYQEWRHVLDTNLTGAFLMCRSFVPHMQGTGYGRIINMTSIMSHVSLPERVAYSSSKAGLLGLTRALALELAADGITVVGISPGPFATEMNTPLLNDPVKNAQFLQSIPVGRWGRVEDIGALARFLCSEEASFITGTDIVIDGGWLAR
ncbi:MAG: SDR family NAD(P)-dependent oxidoreductase [Bryobacteraceae bacterium]|jgi:NAD(P)-dependent dehydrogenase (short-subunit alcohol dehydrogenase family)